MAVEIESWKNRYHSLQKVHGSLTRKCSTQELSLGQANAHCSIPESVPKHSERTNERCSCGDMLLPRSVREQKDTIELLDDTQRRYSKLQKEYRTLQTKHKAVSCMSEKQKRDIETFKRRLAVPPMPYYRNNLGVRPPIKFTNMEGKKKKTQSGLSNSNYRKCAYQGVKHRLSEAEQELIMLREENVVLRNNALVDGDKETTLKLESELKTTLMQLNLVQSKYESLLEKDRTRSDCEKYALDQVEEYNSMLRDLRLQLRKSQIAKIRADELAMYSGEQKEHIEELLQQNQFLEDQVSRLCEAPLIKAMCEKDLTAEIMKYDNKINDLTQELEEKQTRFELVCRERDLFANAASKSKQEAKEMINEKNKELLILLNGLSNEELEEALSIIRKKKEHPTEHQFLEPTNRDLETITALQHKLDSLQSGFIEKNRDFETSERMLQAQLAINEDLKSKFEAQVGKHESLQRDLEQARSLAHNQLQDIKDLKLKIDIEVREKGLLERRNGDGLLRIEILEAQIRQQNLVLADSSGKKCDSLLLDISNFGPEENMLEVSVMDATFLAGIQYTDLTTFALLDFFDFEPQTSYVRKGSSPYYDFTARFRVKTNEYLIQFLKQKLLRLEIYRTEEGASFLFAKSELSLSQLLEMQSPIILQRLALSSIKEQHNKATIGYISIKVKMALPLSEQYKLYERQ